MWIHHLGINQSEALFESVLMQGDKGRLGGIGFAVEHGLATKHLTYGKAIQATYQSTIVPDLEGVGMTQVVQLLVGQTYLFGYPGAGLIFSRHGTTGHHIGKGSVDTDSPILLFQILA